MAPGFSFPPPPPPPPKSASGNPGTGANGYDSYDQVRQPGRGRGHGRGGRRGQHVGYQGHGSYDPGRETQHGYSHESDHLGSRLPSALPPGAFVNPAFAGRSSTAHVLGVDLHNPSYNEKRKWTDDHQPWARDTSYAPHPMRKASAIPREPPAPSVPSFGAPIGLPAKSKPVSEALMGTNKLGLNPSLGRAAVPSDDSGEDDQDEEADDEEAAYSVLKSGPLVIEHEGSIIKLQDGADVKQWIAQRKAMFPSKSRIEAKNVEVQQRIQERRRIEREAELASAPAPAIVQPPPHADLHDDSESDVAPEVVSSKTRVPVADPARAAPRACRTFCATGTCKFGHKCRYQHPAELAPKPKPSGRMTLHQRLVEQELEKADSLGVQAIKYLGDMGFFRGGPA